MFNTPIYPNPNLMMTPQQRMEQIVNQHPQYFSQNVQQAMVNMLWSDFCHIFTDSDYYLKMAKAYLTDEDYPGTPEERAYKNAVKRICYFEHKK